jgi:TrfA protein
MTEPQLSDEGDADVKRRLEAFTKTFEERYARDVTEGRGEFEQSLLPAKVYQLPLWPDPVRGGPNALLRSALFAGIHSKRRQRLGTQTTPEKEPEGVTIASQDGIKIKYAGTQLNQYDADVFFEALHRARLHPLATQCFFRGYDFLKAIGRQNGKREYEDLHDSLTRLRNGHVVIEWEIKGRELDFNGGLIDHYVRDKTNKLYKVTFAKEIKTLFATACWTQLEWDERMALKGHPQAQWMHSYFSSHAAPFPVSVAFLHQKSGSRRALLKDYRTDLKSALATLQKVLGWKISWEKDLITVTRRPSSSQAKFLLAKARSKKILANTATKEILPASEFTPGLLKSLKALPDSRSQGHV